ncbi:hypothetical protein QR680_007687 [Steinernema hermaphroditum]|uniref:Uncharacterized protein n=1 Tax=Steinernema hermaphroditum TaxID=289476 RepID=A0AA39IE05_9BILA|nr:hypothetical protein QR680_007687 [Steinernema hermaphroditum]
MCVVATMTQSSGPTIFENVITALERCELVGRLIEHRVKQYEDRLEQHEKRQKNASGSVRAVVERLKAKIEEVEHGLDVKDRPYERYTSSVNTYTQATCRLKAKEEHGSAEIVVPLHSYVSLTVYEPLAPIKPWRKSKQPWRRGSNAISKTQRAVISILNKCNYNHFFAAELSALWRKANDDMFITFSLVLERSMRDYRMARLYIELVNEVFIYDLTHSADGGNATTPFWLQTMIGIMATRAFIGFVDSLNAKIIYSKDPRGRLGKQLKKALPAFGLQNHRILDESFKKALGEEAQRLAKHKRSLMCGFLRVFSELQKFGMVDMKQVDIILDSIKSTKTAREASFVTKWIETFKKKLVNGQWKQTFGYNDDEDENYIQRKVPNWVNKRNLIGFSNRASSMELSLNSYILQRLESAVEFRGRLARTTVVDLVALLNLKEPKHTRRHESIKRVIDCTWSEAVRRRILRLSMNAVCVFPDRIVINPEVKVQWNDLIVGFLVFMACMRKEGLLTKDLKANFTPEYFAIRGIEDVKYTNTGYVYKWVKKLFDSL